MGFLTKGAFSRRDRVALVLVAITLIYVIAGFYALPRIVKPRLVDGLSQAIHRPVAIQALHINPLSLSVTVSGLTVESRDGGRFVELEELYVNFELSSIFRRAYTFSSIRLKDPYINVAVGRDGRYNFDDLISKDKKSPNKTLPVIISQLEIQNGHIVLEDLSRETPFSTDIAALNFKLQNFTTRLNHNGRYSLDATTQDGEHFRWEGDISVAPLRSHGQIILDNIRARTLWSYAQDALNVEVTQGQLDAHTGYELDFGAGIHVFRLSGAGIDVSGLHLRGKAQGADVLVLPRFNVRGMDVDGVGRTVAVTHMDGDAAKLHVVRRADGEIDLKSVFSPRVVGAGATAAAAGQPSVPWRVRVQQLQLKNWAIEMEDRGTQPSALLRLAPLNLTLDNIAPGTRETVQVAMDAGVNQGGELDVTGNLTLQPLAASLKLRLNGLELVPLQPYVQRRAHVDIRGGVVSSDGLLDVGLAHDKFQLHYAGDAAARNVHIVDTTLNEDFLHWQALSLRGLEYTHLPGALRIQEIVAVKPYLRMTVAADKTTNLSHIVVKPIPATGAPSVVSAPPDAAMPVKIAKICVVDGSMNFSDQSIKPIFAAGIQSLNGTVKGLSSKELARADVDIRGKVDKYAPVTIRGQINPLSEDAFTDITMGFRGVEMTSFTPYSAKFAGYKIDKGKFNVDLRYILSKQVLKGENKIVIDQLELGERVDSPDATSLPVRLAIAILKDGNGVIDIDLPVSGNLNDPDFHYGAIVWKAIKNVIIKVASAPFRAIASLIGGDEQKLSYISYASGSSALTVSERKKIMDLAQALVKRPGLRLEVRGTATEDDRHTIAEAALQQRLVGMGKDVRGGQGVLDLYRQVFNEDPQAGVPPTSQGETRTKDVEKALTQTSAQLRLLQAMAISDEELRALAQARADVVQDALVVQGGVDPGRVFVLEADTKAMPTEGEARVPLTVQAR